MTFVAEELYLRFRLKDGNICLEKRTQFQ